MSSRSTATLSIITIWFMSKAKLALLIKIAKLPKVCDLYAFSCVRFPRCFSIARSFHEIAMYADTLTFHFHIVYTATAWLTDRILRTICGVTTNIARCCWKNKNQWKDIKFLLSGSKITNNTRWEKAFKESLTCHNENEYDKSLNTHRYFA